MLSSAFPFMADVLALRRVAAGFFGVFMSVNPVLAALIGLDLREWFPQLETAEIAGVDHRLHLQGPEGIAAALAEFFIRHPLE